jgi:Na+-translocating ferredoxin:NAD+ oxidoreductase RnfG subunit
MVDEVRGKSKLITYLLMVDKDLTVKDLEVLAYREPYGGEIQYEAFRKQFRGKGTRDQLRVGGDIKNISGATISSNAVTNGVRNLLAVLKELKSAGKLH